VIIRLSCGTTCSHTSHNRKSGTQTQDSDVITEQRGESSTLKGCFRCMRFAVLALTRAIGRTCRIIHQLDKLIA